MANKKEQEKDNRDGVTKRLDAIIRLLMDGQRAQEAAKKITKNEQVLILDSIGLTDAEIGKIVGWPRKDVGSMLSKERKKRKK